MGKAEQIIISKSDGTGKIEIHPEVKKLAILWIEGYAPNGSIMPEIAQKYKLAEDIQRIVNNGISDYKASLKAEIEKDIAIEVGDSYGKGYHTALEDFLDLLENVTPKVD